MTRIRLVVQNRSRAECSVQVQLKICVARRCVLIVQVILQGGVDIGIGRRENGHKRTYWQVLGNSQLAVEDNPYGFSGKSRRLTEKLPSIETLCSSLTRTKSE